MNIYADACLGIAVRCIGGHDTLEHAFNSYITSRELGEWAARERGKYDPKNPKRFKGSQKAWDEHVWAIARNAWEDARHEADCQRG